MIIEENKKLEGEQIVFDVDNDAHLADLTASLVCYGTCKVNDLNPTKLLSSNKLNNNFKAMMDNVRKIIKSDNVISDLLHKTIMLYQKTKEESNPHVVYLHRFPYKWRAFYRTNTLPAALIPLRVEVGIEINAKVEEDLYGTVISKNTKPKDETGSLN